MNLTSWVLVGIGTALFLVGTLRTKRKLSYVDMSELLKDRQQYLLQLRDTTDKMLTRMRELSIEAGKASLEEYYEKYLARNSTYQREYKRQTGKQKDKTVKRKVAIITALRKKGFSTKNLYLYELEDRDKDGLVALRREYDVYYSRNRDKKLTKKLDTLLDYAEKAFSCHALAEMAKHNDFPYKDSKHIAVFYDKPKLLDCWLEYMHKSVNKRFDELIRGEDL